MQHPVNIRQMWDHLFWSDEELLNAVTSGNAVPHEAIREFAHVIGTEEIWLARLERRTPRLAVWPPVSPSDRDRDLHEMLRQTHERWVSYLAGLQEADVGSIVEYVNSAGNRFENTVGDVLLHVALHGQYHRGKVNLMLRQAGLAPAPVDYIAFVRGAPAATEADARRRTS